jgi:hypothetical protein
MLLFRSEEEIDGPRGGVMSTAQLHELARRWYGDRLDPDWRPRSTEDSQAILEAVGLTGSFWQLARPM